MGFRFDDLTQARMFIKEMDTMFNRDTLTGLNCWQFSDYLIVGCVFSKKVDFENLTEQAQELKGIEIVIKNDDWLVELTQKSRKGILGSAGDMV